MATTSRTLDAAVRSLDVTPYQAPTATKEEAHGTLVWYSTSIVVVQAHADRHSGLGFTYCPAELTPDRSRPGLSLELKRDEAERYQVGTRGAG